jgi:hypothetical protein
MRDCLESYFIDNLIDFFNNIIIFNKIKVYLHIDIHIFIKNSYFSFV